MTQERIGCYLLICFAISTTVISCNKSEDQTVKNVAEQREEDQNTVEMTDAQLKNANVVLGKLVNRQISGTIKVNGVLDVPPQQLVSISAPLGGFLKNTKLLQGSRVKKGQVIAIIENLEFIQIQQDYLEAKSQYEFSKADFERQQALAKESVNSQKALQQSKSNYETWQARYHGLREKLKVLNVNTALVEQGKLSSSINLFSPIDGYVTQVNANVGKFVNPVDVLFEIVDTEHLHAELIVFEKDVPKLKIGQKVRFKLANETSERMATVYLIGREISADRTVRIHCHIDEEDTELLPGMYLSAQVETGGALVSALPDEAIIDFDGAKYIFVATVVQEGKHDHAEEDAHQMFEMVAVEVGESELNFTEVKLPDTLKERNPSIVVTGAYALLSMMKNSEEEGHHH